MKKFYLLTALLVTFVTIQAQSWRQIGQDIDGQTVEEYLGYSVSLSADGSIMAIGAYGYAGISGNTPTLGCVRIYQNIEGIWTQIGDDIYGEAEDDRSGSFMSLSADGTIVAIGAPGNDGNGNNAGHVRIFQNLSGTWTQIGADIDGEAAEDMMSGSVSLSADGTTVAIGANGNDGNGNNAGHVRIFQNISGTWTQMGQDINGKAAGDLFGRSVSLSSDGLIVAIGAPWNNGGSVGIYQYISGTWTQKGQDIFGEADEDMSGLCVSLSADGSTVAIGAPWNNEVAGHVRIYQNISDTWTQIGQDIDGEAAGDVFGKSVSLSADGSIVAIGAEQNVGNGSMAGHVRIFQNRSGTWTQIGADINGVIPGEKSGSSVSLSDDGNIVAIGAPNNSEFINYAGRARVFTFTMITSHPSNQTDICIGANVQFSVSGNNLIVYQWQESIDGGANFENLNNNAVYSGTTTADLLISDITNAMNNNQYRCIVTDNALATETSNVAFLTIENESPVITCLGNQIVDADSTHTYTVQGTEFDPAGYSDNCGTMDIVNDFNGLVSLAGAQIPEGMTTIVWTATDYAGNSANCSFDIGVLHYVGINDLADNHISVFPNPTNGKVTVNSVKLTIETIEITDITGKTLLLLSNTRDIDLSNFETGVYFMVIHAQENVFVQKILKN